MYPLFWFLKMSVDLIIDNCPLITRALINPWRLASLGVGLVLLIVGSLYLPSEDWDIPICFVMGIPAYILAPWAFRKIWYFQWKWWPLAALAFWFSVDATYTAYWWCRDFPPLQEFRPANFFCCTPIFWISGFIWNINVTGWRLCGFISSQDRGNAFKRGTLRVLRILIVVFFVLILTLAVAFLAGLQRFFMEWN